MRIIIIVIIIVIIINAYIASLKMDLTVASK